MTVQKKILDLTGSQYLVQKVKSAIKDVDSSLSTHIADTDIHVTTTDKNRWNNNTYVFRYSSTVLTASSTNSNTLLDNTDNLKVGDKVIDSSGVLFSITAIDTANSTFTIGTALIDLAQDSNVVHKSGNETSTGFKQFANIRVTNSIKGINLENTTTDLNNCYSDFAPYGENKGGNIQYYYCNTDAGTANISNLPEAKAFFLTSITTRIISNSLYVKQVLINSNNKTFTRYCNNNTWSSWINETDSEYVHKSGDETIAGIKTFSDLQIIGYGTQYKGSRNAYILPEFSAGYSGLAITTLGFSQAVKIGNFVLDANNKPSLDASKAYIQIATGEVNNVNSCILEPRNSTSSSLGTSTNRWSKIYSTEYYYGSNNVEFTDKFVTTDTAQTVSGTKTFLDIPIPLKSSTAELGVTGGNTKIIFTDKNLLNLAGITFGNYGSSKLSYCRFHIYDKDSNNQEIENFIEFSYVNNNQVAYFRPNKSNFVTLGTVNNRWNKVYADEYYYGSNNVEFSTKFVTTDTNQTISGNKTFKQNITYERTNFYHQVVNPTYILKDTELEKGSLATTHASYPGLWQDKNGNILGYIRFVEYSSGRQTAEFRVSNLIKNGALDPTGSEVNCIVDLELQPSGEKSLIPEINNDVNLGTSTNKWKSFNGLEPSALGMPDLSNGIDISSYITHLDKVVNSYTPTVNGYINIRVRKTSLPIISIRIQQVYGLMTSCETADFSTWGTYLPVVAGNTVEIYISADSLVSAIFFPCQGNV